MVQFSDFLKSSELFSKKKKLQCKLCKDSYEETQIEAHLVGVHGEEGPKEMYTDSPLPPIANETYSSESSQTNYNVSKNLLQKATYLTQIV